MTKQRYDAKRKLKQVNSLDHIALCACVHASRQGTEWHGMYDAPRNSVLNVQVVAPYALPIAVHI